MPYISAALAFEGSVQALTLINSVVKAIQRSRADGETDGLGIADIVARLPAEAFNLAGEFERHVAALRRSFLEKGLDLAQTLDQLESNVWCYQFPQKDLLTSFKPHVEAIRAQFSSFMDDIVAVARCHGEENILAASSEHARERKRQIAEAFPRDLGQLPVGEVLDRLTFFAEQLRAELGGMR
jgi:hypothetical protein